MTVKELRDKLFEIEDQDREVLIHVQGRLSGVLDVSDWIDLDGDYAYLQAIYPSQEIK